MAEYGQNLPRVSVDGRFFRRSAQKLCLKGVAYGPFMPNAQGEPFASPEITDRDFVQIRDLGANLLRIYHVPPRWFLDLAAKHDLLLLIDVPWDKHLCFLDSVKQRTAARQAVCHAVYTCARHPAVFAYSVANEIPPDIVRWSGEKAVAEFIDELVAEAKRADPDCLCTYTNFPSTEFLRPQAVDFHCFNVYLHHPQPFKNYLARLQLIADAKPLVLGEFGMDSLREGEQRQAETLAWQIEGAFRAGLAGAVVFTFTDDWHRGGEQITDWKMGLTTADRKPKPAFRAVQEKFQAAPRFPLPRQPKVSVVVASYNGDRTLSTCLASLERQSYPNYEIILVDDGSTDSTLHIAGQHPNLRCIRHPKNLGLSSARNTGILAATGEIVAFTDSDCRADEDWLYYLVGDLLSGEFAGVGGPNLLPPEDNTVAAAVMVSPGGPAHVMLDDRQAEHIPGCNMAFFKQALADVGGFDPIFMRAGDDVDICWRLQQAGFRIGFSPAAFVWHYRRSTVGAYLKQQRGYGEAEALLIRKHPEYFNAFGGSIWRGRIYTSSKFGLLLQRPAIYRGVFGTGAFQSLYASEPALSLMLFTTVEYYLLVALPLWVLTVTFHYLLPVAVAGLLIPAIICGAAGVQAELPRRKIRWWSRPLVALLFLLQPVVRGWERHQNRLRLHLPAPVPRESLESVSLANNSDSLSEAHYWAEKRIERADFVAEVIRELDRRGWPNRSDIGWSEYDVEIYGNRWTTLQLTTVAEDHPRQRQLIRCRLRSRWSLLARVLFWSVAGLDLIALGFFRHWLLWPLLPAATLGTLAFCLYRQKRAQQSVTIVLLDGLAKKLGLLKIPMGEAAKSLQALTPRAPKGSESGPAPATQSP